MEISLSGKPEIAAINLARGRACKYPQSFRDQGFSD